MSDAFSGGEWWIEIKVTYIDWDLLNQLVHRGVLADKCYVQRCEINRQIDCVLAAFPGYFRYRRGPF